MHRPSLGLSALKASLTASGVAADVAYLNLGFARMIGRRRYEHVIESVNYAALAGEWIFASALGDGENAVRDNDYLSQVLQGRWGADTYTVRVLQDAHRIGREYLEYCARQIPWDRYDVIGFTSSGAQNVAALAIAKRVKESHPGCTVVFGGSNWDGEMGRGLFSAFAWVDYVCQGEADVSFPRLVSALLSGLEPVDVPGVLRRTSEGILSTGESGPQPDMELLPDADHSDYYSALAQTGYDLEFRPGLLLETSRGCAWSVAGPCRFCSQYGVGRKYRALDAPRALAKARALSATVPGATVEFVDNALSPGFLKEALPDLAAEPLPGGFFCEVRPDISREQVSLMAAAGGIIQVGIESLSDHVLRLMHKGASSLENVRLLKWCTEYGVTILWNILYGFPGETEADYESSIDLIGALHSFAPPTTVQPMVLERFSEYFEHASAHGIANVRPSPAYRYTYPLVPEALRRVAYCFDFEMPGAPDLSESTRRLHAAVDDWRRAHGDSELRSRECEGRLVLTDTRSCASSQRVELDELDSFLCAAAAGIATFERLEALAQERFPSRRGRRASLRERLEELVERRLMISSGSRYLSLALPATD